MLISRHLCLRHQTLVTIVFLLTSAVTMVLSHGPSATPFMKPSRKSQLMPFEVIPQYTQIYQVEKLKAEILRGLNLTTVPELPRQKPPQPVTSILNRQPSVSNLSRGSNAAVPDAIIWSEPVDVEEKAADQVLFRVSNQKNKSSVINRVSLILRLRSKKSKNDKEEDEQEDRDVKEIRKKKDKRKSKTESTQEEDDSNTGDDVLGYNVSRTARAKYQNNEIEERTDQLLDVKSNDYQNDGRRLATTDISIIENQEESNEEGDESESDPKKKKKKRKKSARSGKDKEHSGEKRKGKKKKKQRRVKVLVQALNERSGKFYRVAVQRFAIRKKFNWIKLPIPASLVSGAAQSYNQTLVLRIRCKRCHKGHVSIDSALPRKHRRGGKRRQEEDSKFTYVSLNPNRPYLVIRTAEEPLTTEAPQRSTREAQSECGDQPQDDTSCCAQRVDVTFRSLGWDSWIVYPDSFSTVLCQGLCPLAPLAHVQALPTYHNPPSALKLQSSDLQSFGQNVGDVFTLRKRQDAQGPTDLALQVDVGWPQTCAPKDPRPLELLRYTAGNTLVREVIPNFISDSCSCVLS